jgi:ABC-type glycerol-3-phosphate transport system substrate-binding protein
MQRSLFIMAACMLAIACNNKSDSTEEDDDTTVTTENFYWQSQLNDSTGMLEMMKVTTSDSISPQAIVAFLNKEHPNIQLEYTHSSNDTVYLRIPDAFYLTQQMGSSGPQMYLSKVVYNFTELPGIKEVTLDFEEGDHASPGTFNRESFKDQ